MGQVKDFTIGGHKIAADANPTASDTRKTIKRHGFAKFILTAGTIIRLEPEVHLEGALALTHVLSPGGDRCAKFVIACLAEGGLGFALKALGYTPVGDSVQMVLNDPRIAPLVPRILQCHCSGLVQQVFELPAEKAGPDLRFSVADMAALDPTGKSCLTCPRANFPLTGLVR